MNDFQIFFNSATGHTPFDYQIRLVEGNELPEFLDVPTGAGKTAAAILAWLWRRRYHASQAVRQNTPRRLIYCLPMRTLVEQTRDNVDRFLANLTKEDPGIDVTVHLMMGGETDMDWMLKPKSDQIIIGTQDMLLSAALNRGYGMSRFRWPYAFGLLHSDCLWVFDEVQLMGAGLPTSAQLAAFRELFGANGPNKSMWMSATLSKKWFSTPDFRDNLEHAHTYTLSEGDNNHQLLGPRLKAVKKLFPAKLNFSQLKQKYYKLVAQKVRGAHRPGTMTLVIVNQVERAQEIYKQLKKATDYELMLVHSRFRPEERNQLNRQLTRPVPDRGKIVVATQVIEAGVDISASVMFTELAPWSSLVQRFGRCNRYGENEEAEIYWLDMDEKDCLPYTPEEMEQSRQLLKQHQGQSMSPGQLPDVQSAVLPGHVLRRKDIIELFDTTPDLSGQDIDVSRFIRDSHDVDVQVFWRQWDSERPPQDTVAAQRKELCSVQLWAMKKLLGKQDHCWRWDYLGDKWLQVRGRDLRPGMTVLLHIEQGGYSPELGWTGKAKDKMELFEVTGLTPDDTASDHLSYRSQWQTVAQHTDMVVQAMEQLLEDLYFDEETHKALLLAARWHDAGKGHVVFQQTMNSCGITPPHQAIWAKSPAASIRHSQRHFRHELASALAFLQTPAAWQELVHWQRDLVAYLAAAHHGKVRLSIRAMPEERLPEGVLPGSKIARGVWEGSIVAATDLGDGNQVPETVLKLDLMELGGTDQPSWLEKMLALRDKFGPFRLAHMEALLRTADILASQQVRKEVKEDEKKHS